MDAVESLKTLKFGFGCCDVLGDPLLGLDSCWYIQDSAIVALGAGELATALLCFTAGR